MERISWPGGLIWEQHGARLQAQARVLSDMGYAVEEIDKQRFCGLEPAVAHPPERCL